MKSTVELRSTAPDPTVAKGDGLEPAAGQNHRVERLVVLGPGASGKSTFARSIAAATGIPCIELDQLFWSDALEPTSPERWIEIQEDLVRTQQWILDGDLGPYDVLDVRLRHADTVVLFDLPTWRCAWRALRRSRERLDFWTWLLTWRYRYRPRLVRQIDEHPAARLFVVRSNRDLQRVTAALLR